MAIKKSTLKIVSDKKIFFTFIGVIVLAVAVDVFMNFLLKHKELNDQEIELTLELGAVRARLEGQVNTSFSLIHGMEAYISSHPDISQNSFRSFAGTLLKKTTILKNIAAAPDFVIRFMFPLEGNEKALGLDYRSVPNQWAQAQAAKETGHMVLAGPVSLVQGGRGLIARVPVFRTDNGMFWGLVSAVMDFDVLLALAGMTTSPLNSNLAIRGKDDTGSVGEVLWGNAGLFEAASNAVIMKVTIPSGTWEMAGIPEKGWVRRSSDFWMIHLSVTGFVLLIMFGVIQQKRNTLNMTETDNQLKAMSRSSHDALVMIDSEDTVTFWNQAAVTMFGYTEAEMLGKKFHKIVTLPEDMEKAMNGLKNFARTGEGAVMNSIMEMTGIRKSGEVFPVERSVASFKLGGQWCAVGSLRDITARKEYERQLTELATIDALTGLPNRRHFLELSGMELKKAVRYHNAFSLMMFDIDHFKNINDTYGHEAGDKVLQYVAATVKNVVRETDIPGRLGGEEFAVTLPETDLTSAIQAAERLRIAMTAIQVKSGEHTITLSVSIGVVEWDRETGDVSHMIKKADDLLYQAKRSGRNRVVPAIA